MKLLFASKPKKIVEYNNLWVYETDGSSCNYNRRILKWVYNAVLWDGRRCEITTLTTSRFFVIKISLVLHVDGVRQTLASGWKDGHGFAGVDVFLNTWTAQQWEGVEDPVLWAQAGFSPEQARKCLLLPKGHSDRPNEGALEVLAGLSGAL